jgi:glutaredoxin
VRRAAAELGLELALVDLNEDSTARSVLLQARGRATVPVLRIPKDNGDLFLGESTDIVAFLRSWAGSALKAA